MIKKLTIASLTVGLLSTTMMLNLQIVSAESFQTKDIPVENTKYKTIKSPAELVESKLKIEIKDQNRQLKVGDKITDTYLLEGVTAVDSVAGDLTAKITYTIAIVEKTALKIIKKIDTSKPGVYTITYGVTNKEGATVTEASTLTVKEDIKEPELVVERPELAIQDTDKVIEIGEKIDEKFILDGVKAIDLTDGDLTSKITYTLSVSEADKLKSVKKIETSKPATYTVTYAVKNEAGLTSSLSSTIKIVDKQKEVETNKLEISMAYVVKTIVVNEPIDEAFILKGVTATDTIDQDLTDKITYKAVFSENVAKAQTTPVTTIDTAKAGTYTVTYIVKNSSGKTASIEGQIEVLEQPELPKDELTISVPTTEKIVTVGEKVDKSFIIEDVEVTDSVDKNLAGKITYKLSFAEEGSTTSVEKDTFDATKAGMYTVTYSVTNSAGKTATAQGKIQVARPAPAPIITIKDSGKEVKVGDVIDEKLIMEGVTANDEKDGDLTKKMLYTASFSEITVAASAESDKLDTSEPGIYTITYVVENSSGKIDTVDGTITVVGEKQKQDSQPTKATTASSAEKPAEKTEKKLSVLDKVVRFFQNLF